MENHYPPRHPLQPSVLYQPYYPPPPHPYLHPQQQQQHHIPTTDTNFTYYHDPPLLPLSYLNPTTLLPAPPALSLPLLSLPPSLPPTTTKKQTRPPKPLSSSLSSTTPLLLAPDYPTNPAGPASNSATYFKCPKCEKVYKGKHARSIWRRHLQDKHGIPLAAQPRRTRWDNDANRPKSEEERRARTLDSKRRWARKNRAERSGGKYVEGEDDEGSAEPDERDLEDWEEEEDLEEGDSSVEREPTPLLSIPPTMSRSSSFIGEEQEVTSRSGSNGISRSNRSTSQTEYLPPPTPNERIRTPLHHRDTNSYNSHQQDPHPQLSYEGGYLAPLPLHSHYQTPHLQHHQAMHQQPHSQPQQHPSSQAQQAWSRPPLFPTMSQAEYYVRPAPTPVPSLSTIEGRASISNLLPPPQVRPTYEQHHSYYSNSHHQHTPQHLPRAQYGATLRSPVRLGTLKGGPGEAKEDAACVLLALKSGGSSPPNAIMRARREANQEDGDLLSEEDEDEEEGEGEGDTSRESFGFEGDEIELRHQARMIALAAGERDRNGLNKRAASNSPPLPAPRPSPKKAMVAIRGSSSYNEFTSLVATPTPAMRRAMESSPANEAGEDEEEDEEEQLFQERKRGGENNGRGMRQSSFSPCGPMKGKSGGRVMSMSSTRGLHTESGPFTLQPSANSSAPNSTDHKPTYDSAGSSGEMGPPHPGSSSSAASFNLSTPAGPTRDLAAFRPFSSSSYATTLPSSSGQKPNNIDYYSHLAQPHHLRLATGAYNNHSRTIGLSSPPTMSLTASVGGNNYFFSSPAHPGISKQLGLSALPGPGVLNGRGGGEEEEAKVGWKEARERERRRGD